MSQSITHSFRHSVIYFFHSTPSSSQEKQSGTIEFAEYLRDVTYKNYSTCDEIVVIVASQQDVQVGSVAGAKKHNKMLMSRKIKSNRMNLCHALSLETSKLQAPNHTMNKECVAVLT